MTEKSDFQSILEHLATYEYGFEIRPYSGRGMYGKECVAVVIERDTEVDIFELGFAVGERAEKLGLDIGRVRGMRSDSMGLGSVYYWPHIPYHHVEEAGYDEEETNE